MLRLALLALGACACHPRAGISEVPAAPSPVDAHCASLRAEALATLAAAERGPDNRDGIRSADIQQLPSVFGSCVPTSAGTWVLTLDRVARGGCHGFCAEVDYSLHHLAPNGSVDASFDLEPGEGFIVPYGGWSLALRTRDATDVEVDESLTLASAYSGDGPVTTTTLRSVRVFGMRAGAIEERSP